MLKVEGLQEPPFLPEAVDSETAEYAAQLEANLATATPPQAQGVAAVRAAARSGNSLFGPLVFSELAENRTIDSPTGKVSIRVFTPPTVKGVYLYFHGGGFAFGAADLQDMRLEEIALTCQVAVISVDYRLAPENPYPAAHDDSEAAALWLGRNAKTEFGTEEIVIGGESAGAYLSAVTLLRLRDKHGFAGFRGANLLYGAYDLGGTPSLQAWGDRYLILSKPYIDWCMDMFIPGQDRMDPDISPLYANLASMPPALFSIGTVDPLVDDTLFMYGRWIAAGNQAQIAVYPGATHAFPLMPIAIAKRGSQRCCEFIKQSIGVA